MKKLCQEHEEKIKKLESKLIRIEVWAISILSVTGLKFLGVDNIETIFKLFGGLA